MRMVIPESEIRAKDYLSEYNCRPPPIFIPLFTILEVGMFVYYAYTSKGPQDQTVSWDRPSPKDSPLIYCPSRRYEAWRYISYMLVHEGYQYF